MNSERSVSVATASGSAGAKKLGQPVPDSNFASERNSSAPQPAQRYVPERCSSHSAPVNARSVPFSRSTRYCSGVSSARHSASDLATLVERSVFMSDFPCSARDPTSGARPHNYARYR